MANVHCIQGDLDALIAKMDQMDGVTHRYALSLFLVYVILDLSLILSFQGSWSRRKSEETEENSETHETIIEEDKIEQGEVIFDFFVLILLFFVQYWVWLLRWLWQWTIRLQSPSWKVRIYRNFPHWYPLFPPLVISPGSHAVHRFSSITSVLGIV